MTGMPAHDSISQRAALSARVSPPISSSSIPTTILDIATFTDPIRPAEGIQHVWVNGTCRTPLAGATGQRAGQLSPSQIHSVGSITHASALTISQPATSDRESHDRSSQHLFVGSPRCSPSSASSLLVTILKLNPFLTLLLVSSRRSPWSRACRWPPPFTPSKSAWGTLWDTSPSWLPWEPCSAK